MYTVGELAKQLNGQVQGDETTPIQGVGSLDHAKPSELAFFADPRYLTALKETCAGAVLVTEDSASDCPVTAIVVANPQLSFVSIASKFDRRIPVPKGIHPTAIVAEDVQLSEDVCIGPYVNIAQGAVIEEGVELGAHVSIGADVRIGTHTSLRDNVVIYHDVKIGMYCTIHSNTVIGADGFGIAPKSDGTLTEVPQLGGVTLGDRVLVGASTTIDRGTIDDTVIEDGVKIDDQVHIAHNCRVGANSILCGRASLAGSVTLGQHCVLGGDAGIAGEGPVVIASGVEIGAKTYVSRDISEPGRYSGGTLHMKNSIWRRNAMRFNDLDQWVKRILRLEKQVGRSDQQDQ